MWTTHEREGDLISQLPARRITARGLRRIPNELARLSENARIPSAGLPKSRTGRSRRQLYPWTAAGLNPCVDARAFSPRSDHRHWRNWWIGRNRRIHCVNSACGTSWKLIFLPNCSISSRLRLEIALVFTSYSLFTSVTLEKGLEKNLRYFLRGNARVFCETNCASLSLKTFWLFATRNKTLAYHIRRPTAEEQDASPSYLVPRNFCGQPMAWSLCECHVRASDKMPAIISCFSRLCSANELHELRRRKETCRFSISRKEPRFSFRVSWHFRASVLRW